MEFEQDSANDTIFGSLQKKLKRIKTEVPNDPTRIQIIPLIDRALRAPILSIAEEMDLYRMLDGHKAVQARATLVESHFPIVVVMAWEEFRVYGVPFDKMVETGRHGLELAALQFEYKPHPHKSFYYEASDKVVEFFLNKLDEFGLEQVEPLELQKLENDGKTSDVEQILAPLTAFERNRFREKYFFEKTMPPSVERHRTPGSILFEKMDSVMLRKLRQS